MAKLSEKELVIANSHLLETQKWPEEDNILYLHQSLCHAGFSLPSFVIKRL